MNIKHVITVLWKGSLKCFLSAIIDVRIVNSATCKLSQESMCGKPGEQSPPPCQWPKACSAHLDTQIALEPAQMCRSDSTARHWCNGDNPNINQKMQEEQSWQVTMACEEFCRQPAWACAATDATKHLSLEENTGTEIAGWGATGVRQ